eukprot:2368830-Amphidinium_carterae.1
MQRIKEVLTQSSSEWIVASKRVPVALPATREVWLRIPHLVKAKEITTASGLCARVLYHRFLMDISNMEEHENPSGCEDTAKQDQIKTLTVTEQCLKLANA